MNNPLLYIVENWDTDEIIMIFNDEDSRQAWLDLNVVNTDDGGYLKDGTKISIYETHLRSFSSTVK